MRRSGIKQPLMVLCCILSLNGARILILECLWCCIQAGEYTTHAQASCADLGPCMQGFTARLHSQLQAVEADVAELCRAARVAGPGPGTPMSQVLERPQQQEEEISELDLSAAPLPPTEHVVDEGAAPMGTGYEILLQVCPALPAWELLHRHSTDENRNSTLCAAVVVHHQGQVPYFEVSVTGGPGCN